MTRNHVEPETNVCNSNSPQENLEIILGSWIINPADNFQAKNKAPPKEPSAKCGSFFISFEYIIFVNGYYFFETWPLIQHIRLQYWLWFQYRYGVLQQSNYGYDLELSLFLEILPQREISSIYLSGQFSSFLEVFSIKEFTFLNS